MEIMVVVAIILILAGAGIVVYQNMLGDANVTRAKMDVRNLETVVTTYYTKHGFYPNTLQELCYRDPDGSPAMLKDETALIDPWRQPYQYEPGTRHPQNDKPLLYSQGPPQMGKPIRNWD
jgi:type II secretory pathway pseudopilin PulG